MFVNKRQYGRSFVLGRVDVARAFATSIVLCNTRNSPLRDVFGESSTQTIRSRIL